MNQSVAVTRRLPETWVCTSCSRTNARLQTSCEWCDESPPTLRRPSFDEDESTMPSMSSPDFVAISEIRRTPLQNAPTIPPARAAQVSLWPLYVLQVFTLSLILAASVVLYITLR